MYCASILNVVYRLSCGFWTDNTAAISVAAEAVLHQRTKHIGIKFQYANENIENGTVKNVNVILKQTLIFRKNKE